MDRVLQTRLCGRYLKSFCRIRPMYERPPPKKRLGNFQNTTLAVGANNGIIPANPSRKYLYISSSNATAITIGFGGSIAGSANGFRIAAGQAGIEFDSDKVGDIVQQTVSVWNAGSAGSSFAWVEASDYDQIPVRK